MKTAFLIHGTDASSERGWFPWMKGELEKLGYTVIVPNFPSIVDESYENWLAVIKPYLQQITPESIFIGHSLGALFILSLLSREDIHIKRAYLVAGWGEKFTDEQVADQYKKFIQDFGFDKPIKTMYNYESFIDTLEFGRMKERCESFYIFHSVDDPYVPVELGRRLKDTLGGEYFEYPHAGHFNKTSGFDKFEDLAKLISE